jgi:tetratricopeptide (TPR) repeat protein
MPETTRFRDRYGLPLTAGAAIAVQRYLKGIDQFLSLDIGAEVSLAQAIEADEAFTLAHAALALTQQFQGASDEAKLSVMRARARVAGTSRRERQHVDAIATFVDGGGRRALALVHEHLDEFPRDAMLLFLHSFLVARSGSPDWQQEQFAYLTALAPRYGDDWYFLGHYAFAHHALDRFEESRRLAERALASYPRCGQAAHSLAHVFYETNAHAGGVDFLGEWMADYDRRAPMYCHLAWHQALFAPAMGHYARVMDLYTREIRPEVAQTRTSMYDAASLLWRYQLYGCAQGSLPWPAVCELAASMTAQPGMAFVDANAALALAAGGDPAAFQWLGRAQVGSGRATEARLSLQEAQTRWSGADAGATELAALEQTQRLAQAAE